MTTTQSESHDTDSTPNLASALADEIADHILARLRTEPALLDALADRIIDRLNSTKTTPTTPSDEAEAMTAEQVMETSAEAVLELRGWVMTHHPDLVAGDADSWAAGIVAAATPKLALPMMRWAMSADCNTDYWRHRQAPLVPPRPGRRSRHGDCAQLIAEYRAATTHPTVSRQIDQITDGVRVHVTNCAVHEFRQDPARARKSALDLLSAHNWDAAQIVAIIGWGLSSRPHWRSNVKGVPTKATFAKIRGDWIADGRPAGPATAAADDAEVHTIAEGWVYHYGRLRGYRHMAVTPNSRRHIADCLTGADGADPITVDELKGFVRWLCDRENRHTQYLVRGVDFPPIANVRRGLISMATAPARTAVATTNQVAAGQVATPIDVFEV